MIFNNAFLKYDQYGFQQILFVGVPFLLYRSTKPPTFSALVPKCIQLIQLAAYLKTKQSETILTTIWTPLPSEDKWIHILAVQRKDSYSKIKTEHWLDRTFKGKSSAMSTWLPQVKNTPSFPGSHWRFWKAPVGIRKWTTPWPSHPHGESQKAARFSTLMTVIVPNFAKTITLAANGT